MTLDSFKKQLWTAGMKVRYHGDGKIYHVASCDFEEKLVRLRGGVRNDSISWVRCENVSLVDSANTEHIHTDGNAEKELEAALARC